MRLEVDLTTGQVTELPDAPLTSLPPPTVKEQLSKLDSDNQLSQRNLREVVMLLAEAAKTLSMGALDLSTIPGVAKVYEVEAQAVTLRAQL